MAETFHGNLSRRMRTVSILAFAALVTSCSNIPTDYGGGDAGHVVVGLGSPTVKLILGETRPQYLVTLFFRRSGEDARGRISWVEGLFGPRRDYETASEAGIVETISIPAGKYELVNFNFVAGGGRVHYWAKHDFSIPFELKPGDIIYLGNYQANSLKYTFRDECDRLRDGGTPILILEDRFQDDIALARKRGVALPLERARNTTPDLASLNHPLLVPAAKVPAARENLARQPPPTGKVADFCFNELNKP